MYRTAIEDLHQWKAKQNKKPLIIRSARQVGKTWLMKEFGRVAFDKTVYKKPKNVSGEVSAQAVHPYIHGRLQA